MGLALVNSLGKRKAELVDSAGVRGSRVGQSCWHLVDITSKTVPLLVLVILNVVGITIISNRSDLYQR